MGCVRSWYSAAFRRRVSAKASHAACTPSWVSSFSFGSSALSTDPTSVFSLCVPPLRAALALPTRSDNRGVFNDTPPRGFGIGGGGVEGVAWAGGTGAGSAIAGASSLATLIFFLTLLLQVLRDEERNGREPSS